MLKSTEAMVTLCSKNIQYYKDRKYDVDSLKVERKWGLSIPRGTKLLVKIEDLPPYSKVVVDVECDYCHIGFTKIYSDYTSETVNGIIKKDCCSNNDCLVLKRNESNLITYGFENTFQVEEFKEKSKETNLSTYGHEYASQSEVVKEKLVTTMVYLYGFENYTKTEEYKEKSKHTNLAKYGVEHHSQCNEIKNKNIQTNLARYGVENPMHVDEFKNKAITNMLKSKYKNKTGLYSSQQEYLCNLLDGELNYPIGRCLLDVAFLENKKYLEYDGGFHDGSVILKQMTREAFNLREINRYYYLKNLGWGLIKIISKKDYLPTDKVIFEMINYAKQYLENHSWIHFDIDRNIVISSQGELDYNFGELRKIIKEEIKHG